MRALLDANLFISYLLSATPVTSAMGAILAAGAAERFVLLFTPGVADETVCKVAERTDLAARITAADVAALLADLAGIAEPVPPLTGPFAAICRDHKDDYLIAHAQASNADFLISWDKDLRDLQHVDELRIVSPPELLRAPREAGIL
ncbi:MAG: putative toxin-antitoxin system toxin component, PIN family [Chloroflexota bacterium]|nr:putative toxin-antitoxin system toxin component, PIN family [Chloroflexota bacterium]